MYSHIHVGVSDFERALAFYGRVMFELGNPLKFVEYDRPWAGWMPAQGERPLFLIGRPYDGQPHAPGNGQMVAFLAPNRKTVDRVHAVALAAGGRSEGEPGPRPEYHPTYYGAYLRDLDGNKICICCHQPESE